MRKPDITAAVVTCLVETQFPQWAGLPVRPVDHDGWDNTTYRLGDELSVRLPSADWYTPQVDKEHTWLPVLAPQLPLPIPQPVARGVPGCGFPRPWSVFRWLPGAHATLDRVADLTTFARSLGAFLAALYAVPTEGGPPPGDHNFNRGAPPSIYDGQTREAVAYLADEIDASRALAVWDACVAAPWDGRAVWLHGDLSATNLLVAGGRLTAVIDFGTAAVGDPACDFVIGWTFFSGESRRAFRDSVPLDDAAWERGRAWALWKALITLAAARREDPASAGAAGLQFGWRAGARELIDDLLG